MDVWPWVFAGAGVVVGMAVLIVANVLGEGTLNAAAEAVFRRPDFARRRGLNRGLLKSGYLCLALAPLPGLMWMAAATSGHPSDADDAGLFGAVSAVLVAAGFVLLVFWWRLADRRRHH